MTTVSRTYESVTFVGTCKNILVIKVFAVLRGGIKLLPRVCLLPQKWLFHQSISITWQNQECVIS